MYAQRWKSMSALFLVFALGIGTSSLADSGTVRYGQGSCSTSYDNSNGRSLEFYSEKDTSSNGVTVGFTYKIEFQNKNIAPTRCDRMQHTAEAAMRVELAKQQIELETMRLRLEQLKSTPEQRVPENAPTNFNDDW